MGRASYILCLLTLSTTVLFAQSSSTPGKRLISYKAPVYQTHSFNNQTQTLRIEKGFLWINGNLIPTKELPKDLQKVNEQVFFQLTLHGANEFKFNFEGKEYLLKHGMIVEIPPAPTMSRPENELVGSDKNYFAEMKNSAPQIFSGLRLEADLYEQCMALVLDYQIANEEQKEVIAHNMRQILSLLFDISLQNQLEEIYQFQKDIENIKDEIEFRKRNKEVILDNRLEELTQRN